MISKIETTFLHSTQDVYLCKFAPEESSNGEIQFTGACLMATCERPLWSPEIMYQ